MPPASGGAAQAVARAAAWRATAGRIAEDMAVECPLHGSAFNVETGDPDAPPATEAVQVFAVTVDGDDVLVEV